MDDNWKTFRRRNVYILTKEIHANYMCNKHDACQATLCRVHNVCMYQQSGESSELF